MAADVVLTVGPGGLPRLLEAVKAVRPNLDLSAEAAMFAKVTLKGDLTGSVKLPDGTALSFEATLLG